MIPGPYVAPADRDVELEADALERLAAAARYFAGIKARYRLAHEARADAVRRARDAGLSHDEIAGVLGVTRAVSIRLDRRTHA